MDLSEVQPILRNRNAQGSVFRRRFPGVQIPGLRTNLVFVSPHGKHAAQAAAKASSLGFSKCASVVGGMAAIVPLLDSDMNSLTGAQEDVTLSRDAFLTLLESMTTHLISAAKDAVIIDIRRYDERVFFGSVRGTVHVLLDHIPKALLLGDEDWFRSFRFPKPQPETLVVILSSCPLRANWARQLLCDSGIMHTKMYSFDEGIAWSQSSRVSKYEMYEEGAAPPKCIDLGMNSPFSRAKGEAELRKEVLSLRFNDETTA